MSAASAYIAAITTRRSIYALSKALPAGELLPLGAERRMSRR